MLMDANERLSVVLPPAVRLPLSLFWSLPISLYPSSLSGCFLSFLSCSSSFHPSITQLINALSLHPLHLSLIPLLLPFQASNLPCTSLSQFHMLFPRELMRQNENCCGFLEHNCTKCRETLTRASE